MSTPEPGGSYIMYKNCPDDWRLNSGAKPPERKYWLNPSFDQETLTFTGLIDWSDDPFIDHYWHPFMDHYWQYTIIFSKDLTEIQKGTI